MLFSPVLFKYSRGKKCCHLSQSNCKKEEKGVMPCKLIAYNIVWECNVTSLCLLLWECKHMFSHAKAPLNWIRNRVLSVHVCYAEGFGLSGWPMHDHTSCIAVDKCETMRSESQYCDKSLDHAGTYIFTICFFGWNCHSV